MSIDISLFNKLVQITTRTSDGAVTALGENTAIFYYQTLVESKFVIENIKRPYVEYGPKFYNYLITIAVPINVEDVQDNLLFGGLIILYENKVMLVKGIIKREGRTVTEPIREASFEGGLETFVEQTNVNINLIRQYYFNDKMEIKKYKVGPNNKNVATVIYNSEYVDENVLKAITDKLSSGKIPDCQSTSQLGQHLIKGQYIFPRVLSTERPDRVIFAMNKGRVAIFLEGTSAAIIAPATMHDFFDTVDDRYLMPLPSMLLLFLRYIAFVAALISPSLYVIVAGYNPEILRVQLAVSLQGSRAGVPYASFIEVIFMLLLMEFLIEASLRLPKTIGQTATTVGGLILGQGATQAGLVSNIMVIIVSTVAISAFVIPITSMNVGVRVVKYVLLLFTLFGGLIGFLCGILSIAYYLSSLKSFNISYLNPMAFRLHSFTAMFKRGK